jgi:PucR family transcriptional regulator, purine catabolism regulatory protein
MTGRSGETKQDALLQELVDDFERAAGALTERLRDPGLQVGLSAPRREPARLPDAVREAMLMTELFAPGDTGVDGQEETYRLLIGVLLRDPGELEQLRTSTIAPLLAYDDEHETGLLVTLEAFLAHHGSTTETAEAMGLHRHTVGYRLSRIHEVSGLSPYESDGRERLSLGLKAAHILAAQKRLSQPG